MGETSTKINAQSFMEENWFCTEQPVLLPLPYQQESIDEREKINIFWKSSIS